MNQCIHAVGQLGIPSSTSLKRRLSTDYTEHAPKKPATVERPEYSLHTSYHSAYHQPPPGPPHVTILPRLTSSDHRDPRTPAKVELPKKRGRPSRADKAKRDLQPLLPRPAAPQASPTLLAPQSPSEPHNPGQAGSHPGQNGLAPLAPKRTAVPSLLASPVTAARPITPPEAYIPRSRSPSSPMARTSTASPRGERPWPSTQQREKPEVGAPYPQAIKADFSRGSKMS